MLGLRRAVGAGQLLFFLISTSWLLHGCAVNPRMSLGELTGSTEQIVLDTPFFPQTAYQCGPAALAGILNATGLDVSPESLREMVYLPDRHGSLQLELLAATRRLQRIAYVIEDDPEVLLAQINAGLPVLVLQNLGTRSTPLWHYAVLTGFDVEHNALVLNSGKKRGLRTPANTFLRTWDWADRWAMVALPAGQLPAMTSPGRYAETVAIFERTASTSDALLAWQAAEQHWPDDSRFQLALGNLHYAQGKPELAADRYRQGLKLSPDDPALSNNLAAVLGELGCPRAGEKLLRSILLKQPPSSAWIQPLQQTSRELEMQPGSDPQSCAALFSGPS